MTHTADGIIFDYDKYGRFMAWLTPFHIETRMPFFEINHASIGYWNKDLFVKRYFKLKIISKRPRRGRGTVTTFKGKTYFRFIRGKTIITFTIPGYFDNIEDCLKEFASYMHNSKNWIIEQSHMSRLDIIETEKIKYVENIKEETIQYETIEEFIKRVGMLEILKTSNRMDAERLAPIIKKQMQQKKEKKTRKKSMKLKILNKTVHAIKLPIIKTLTIKEKIALEMKR